MLVLYYIQIMQDTIDAILFDMGGTLRRNRKRDPVEKAAIVQQIMDLLGLQMPAPEFTKILESRAKSYESWATGKLIELNEIDLWTKWMLPDLRADNVGPLAMQLNEIWREAIASRVLFPETKATILKLHERGYQLAVVSNTTSSVDSPRALEEADLAAYFDAIILSCVLGKRKPGADILLHAAGCLNVDPSRCVYVGDRPEWDVVSARKAGFRYAIIVENPFRPLSASLPQEQIPDYSIKNLLELLDIFPQRNPLQGISV